MCVCVLHNCKWNIALLCSHMPHFLMFLQHMPERAWPQIKLNVSPHFHNRKCKKNKNTATNYAWLSYLVILGHEQHSFFYDADPDWPNICCDKLVTLVLFNLYLSVTHIRPSYFSFTLRFILFVLIALNRISEQTLHLPLILTLLQLCNTETTPQDTLYIHDIMFIV